MSVTAEAREVARMGDVASRWRRGARWALALVALASVTAGAQGIDLSKIYRQQRALVIGINTYGGGWTELNYARGDAEAVGRKLESLGFRVEYLLDQQATRERILTKLGELESQVAENDQVFFYFSGHGDTREVGAGEARRRLGYVVPADANRQNPYTAISMETLRELSGGLKARHVMFALDSCFSGSLLHQKGPAAPREKTPGFIQDALRRPVRFVLTAGTAGQRAVEVEGRGLFTRQLLLALDGAATRDRSGIVTGMEIADYVRTTVRDIARQRYGRVQTPVAADLEGQGDGEFLLALKARPPPPPPPPPPPVPAPPSGPAVAAVPPGGARIESTPPGADVFIDTRPVGKTPVDVPSVAPGRRQLVMNLEGYKTLIEPLDVVAGQPLRIVRTLEAQTGTLEILVKPAGARITVDGVPMGAAPQRLAGVRVGKRKVTLSHDDYQSVEREVQVDFDQLARLDVELSPKPARLLVTSTPGQADVWVGNRKLGLTVWNGELTPGRHQVRVAKEGYEDRLFDVDLGPNEARTLDAQLKKWDLGEMVPVPAGEFVMGSNDYDDEKPPHRVYLDAFLIDKFEVTNVQFKAFVDARGYERQELWSAEGWRWRPQGNVTRPGYWSEAKWNEPKQPVVGVSWYEAEAFCKFAGKRLPTEAEWEKAARGADGRKYPWGEQWDRSRANSGESGLGKTVAVGSYLGGASPYGAQDMAGNVWEWVADWYDSAYYKRSPERNPRGPDSGSSRVLRGGSWGYNAIFLRTASRHAFSPDYRYGGSGFRCARGLP